MVENISTIENINRIPVPNTDIELYSKIYLNEKQSENLIVILHDYFDYHKRYVNLKNILMESLETDVALFDFQGFGMSGGKRGKIDSIISLKNNIEVFIEKAESHKTYSKITFLGVGLGGLASIDFLLNSKLNTDASKYSQILLNPMIKLKSSLLQKVESFLASTLKLDIFIPEYEIFDNTSDLHLAQELHSDPLAIKGLNPDSFEVIKTLSEGVKNNMYFLENHTMIAIGAKGKVVDNNLVKLFHKALPGPSCNLKQYDESGHDLIHDVEKDTVIKDIVLWLQKLA